jgi:hypothetical protein
MEKLFYVPAVKMNAKLQETKMEGFHISIDGYTYERLSRRPVGRPITRRLLNTATEEQIVIYS